jgi:transcriptional regulator
MYTPASFQELRIPVLHAFMRQRPFATVVSLAAGRLGADHVPLILEAEPGPLGSLRGHIARANCMWKEVEDGAEVLVVFQGENCYVSPRWYPSKQEHGKVVPTWNYGVVHARGRIAWHHDARWLRRLVEESTDGHEAAHPRAWQVSDAPDEYIAGMIRAIVGFSIAITELDGKMKYSQNRSAADRAGVVAGLAESGKPMEAQVAAIMSKQPGDSGG